MMYRSIETGMWDDPWFAELMPNAKLLFIYLITNRRVTACGAFEIQRRALSFETGLSGDAVKEALAALAEKVTWWSEHQIVFVHKFYRWQRANTGPSFTTSARASLARMPADVQETVAIAYPELAAEPNHPPSPSPNGQTTHGIPTVYPSDTHPTATVEAGESQRTPTGHRLTVTETETETGQQREERRADADAPATLTTAKPKTSRKKPRTPIAEPFVVSEGMFAWADERGFSDAFVRDATEYFVRWAKSHGHLYADWRATWENVLESRWSEQHGGKVVRLRSTG